MGCGSENSAKVWPRLVYDSMSIECSAKTWPSLVHGLLGYVAESLPCFASMAEREPCLKLV